MIEDYFKALIDELGANGILLIGLYLLLYRPLQAMATSLKTINGELAQIIELMTKK